MLEQMVNNLDIFTCPACGGDLELNSNNIKCLKCSTSYQVEDGVPLLFLSNDWDNSKKDVTKEMRSFYEKTPFPNYEDLESTGDLIQKAQKGFFARLLNEQVPFNTRVLEVGCGTGQLSNFLGTVQRNIFGVDITINSLKLAEEFRRRNGLDRVGFYQMNLFRPIFKEETFHLVISNGVLHHTSDPFGGFKSISRLVKKNGYILIGLYNKYGRLITDARRIVFKVFNNRFRFLDPRLRNKSIGDIKKFTWFMDQYKNPHESKHTIGEVLKWFDQTGFEFVNSIPKLKAFKKFYKNERLFKSNPRGNWFDHFLAQSSLFLKGSEEGGLFIMIGKKKS